MDNGPLGTTWRWLRIDGELLGTTERLHRQLRCGLRVWWGLRDCLYLQVQPGATCDLHPSEELCRVGLAEIHHVYDDGSYRN